MPAEPNSELLVVLTTAPSDEVAERLSRMMVEQGLAACVSRISGVRSTYMWEGKVQSEVEVQLIIKTVSGKWEKLLAFAEEHHPYENPELVALDAARVAPDYLLWVQEHALAVS